MASCAKIKRSIIIWVGKDPSKLAEVKMWLDTYMREMLESGGQTISQGSTNGSSFSFGVSITIGEWVSILTDVIDQVENGNTPVTKTIGVISPRY